MRAFAILAVLTACRWHFDAVTSGDGGDGDGDFIDPTGDATPIAGVQTTLSATGTCAAVAWAGDRAGVVWREGTTDVWFATVAPSGSYVEAPMEIGMGLANLACPAITWAGNARFIVALDTVVVDGGGNVTAGPVTHAIMRAEKFDAVWTGSRYGVLYNESYGLVQSHLAQFATDGTLINDVPVVSSRTTTELGLAWTGTQYVAAVESNQGVIVKFIDPP